MKLSNNEIEHIVESLPEKKLILSFYLDYESGMHNTHNLSELSGVLYSMAEVNDATVFDEMMQHLTFKKEPNNVDTFLEDYFHERGLAVPPRYSRDRHIYGSRYTIFRMIYWITYPNSVSFQQMSDSLHQVFKYISDYDQEEGVSAIFNVSIVPINPKDGLVGGGGIFHPVWDV